MRNLVFIGLSLFVFAEGLHADPAGFTPERATVVVATPESGPARGGIHRAKLGQAVSLYAAVEGRIGRRRVVVTSTGSIVLNGKKVPSRRLVRPDRLPEWKLRWYKVEPTGDSYDNTVGGFHWDEIEYREHPIGEWGTDWQVPADAHPAGTYPDTHGGAGTMAFMVRIRLDGKELASPGKDSLDRGGLDAKVPRVAFRRDDSLIGRLTELFNTPYIWGSAGIPPEVHQAERLIGSDCADFVVYGARRMGKKLRYRASWHIPEVSDLVVEAEKIDDKGRYLTGNGKMIPVGDEGVRIGDLLLFHGHVGALSADRKPLGILDINDIMIHTYWAPPDEEPIRETAYKEAKLKVYRFK